MNRHLTPALSPIEAERVPDWFFDNLKIVTALQRYSVTALQRYSVTALQRYSVTALQRYSVTALQRYSVTALQRYSVTALQRYSVTALQRYSVTALQRYSVTMGDAVSETRHGARGARLRARGSGQRRRGPSSVPPGAGQWRINGDATPEKARNSPYFRLGPLKTAYFDGGGGAKFGTRSAECEVRSAARQSRPARWED